MLSVRPLWPPGRCTVQFSESPVSVQSWVLGCLVCLCHQAVWAPTGLPWMVLLGWREKELCWARPLITAAQSSSTTHLLSQLAY